MNKVIIPSLHKDRFKLCPEYNLYYRINSKKKIPLILTLNNVLFKMNNKNVMIIKKNYRINRQFKNMIILIQKIENKLQHLNDNNFNDYFMQYEPFLKWNKVGALSKADAKLKAELGRSYEADALSKADAINNNNLKHQNLFFGTLQLQLKYRINKFKNGPYYNYGLYGVIKKIIKKN